MYVIVGSWLHVSTTVKRVNFADYFRFTIGELCVHSSVALRDESRKELTHIYGPSNCYTLLNLS